jgi:hypothetical protein
MKHLISILLLASFTVACSKEEPKKEEPAPVEEPKPVKQEPKEKPIRVSALAPDEPRTRVKELPTSADLEEEAGRTVAVENLEAELDRLEAEIVGSPE